MALSAADTAWLDAQLGPGTWTSADLEARFARTGSLPLAAREVLEGRLSTFRSQSAQLTVPGEIQFSNTENIHALERQLEDLPIPPPPDGGAGWSGGAPARVIQPDTRRWRR